jgi:hypothetical protein
MLGSNIVTFGPKSGWAACTWPKGAKENKQQRKNQRGIFGVKWGAHFKKRVLLVERLAPEPWA